MGKSIAVPFGKVLGASSRNQERISPKNQAPASGDRVEESKTFSWKRRFNPNVYSSIIHKGTNTEGTDVLRSADDGLRERHIHTMEHTSSGKMKFGRQQQETASAGIFPD